MSLFNFWSKPEPKGKTAPDQIQIFIEKDFYLSIFFSIIDEQRQVDRQLRKVGRDIERDRRELEREEKKLVSIFRWKEHQHDLIQNLRQ